MILFRISKRLKFITFTSADIVIIFSYTLIITRRFITKIQRITKFMRLYYTVKFAWSAILLKNSKLIHLPFSKVRRQKQKKQKINGRSMIDCTCNKWRRTLSEVKISRWQKVHLLRNWFHAADADFTLKCFAELKFADI